MTKVRVVTAVALQKIHNQSGTFSDYLLPKHRFQALAVSQSTAGIAINRKQRADFIGLGSFKHDDKYVSLSWHFVFVIDKQIVKLGVASDELAYVVALWEEFYW